MKYDLTDEQFNAIINASQPVMMIALQCGTPQSPQENANQAWRKVANEVGCRFDTIQPYPGSARSFIAEPVASAIEARSDATGTGAAEGKSAVGDSRDAQPPTKEPTP